jgi:hypothetical protein
MRPLRAARSYLKIQRVLKARQAIVIIENKELVHEKQHKIDDAGIFFDC